jgi:hypothetical protein
MDEWLVTLGEALAEDPPDDAEIALLLDAAREVAHGVERRLTPIATFVVGMSVERRIADGLTRDEAIRGALDDLRRTIPAS